MLKQVRMLTARWRAGGWGLHLLLLGHSAFAGPLRGLGHRVTVCGPDQEADLRLEEPDPDWARVERLARGLDYDAILVTDDVGFRRLPSGLWRADAVTAFYGVDAPLNRFWQTDYAHIFDLAWLDQPAEAQSLCATHAGAGWLPLGVDPGRYTGEAPSTPRPGVCFVGVVEPTVRPKRSALLEKVGKLAPLVIRGGRQDKWFSTEKAAELYREYQVVLNENLFPGFTTRPLEVMASGGCLLSEAAPGSLDQYFQHDRDLLYFTPENLEQLLESILTDQARRRRLAAHGREKVLAGHTLAHRAAKIVSDIKDMMAIPPEGRPRVRDGEALRREGQALFMAGLRWPDKGGSRRVLRGAARLKTAAADGADPLLAPWQAGCAALALGREQEALNLLQLGLDPARPENILALACAAWQAGKPEMARQVQASLRSEFPGLAAGPGQAQFHLDAARLLSRAGQDFRAGFNAIHLPPAAWTALEHLQQAVSLEPGRQEAWEQMGDLLERAGSPNQASFCFQKALGIKASPALSIKAADAARKGYLA
jgi:tetratricopeptide (TPR) repeat protein